MTSSILFQTIFPLGASLPAETRAAVACRRAGRCSSRAALWCAPAPLCQGDSSGRSFPLGQVCSFGSITLLEACCGPGAFLSGIQLTFIAGCIAAVQTEFSKALLPSTSIEDRNASSPGNHLSLLSEHISEQVWYFPSLDTTFFPLTLQASARTFSERLNPSAHQEVQDAKHRNFPSHFQRRGQSRLCPVARRPIYRHPFAAGTGKRSQTGTIPGAPRPWDAFPPRRGRTHRGAGAASPRPGAFPFPSATSSSKAHACRGWWQGGTKPALCTLTALRDDLIVFPSSEQQFAGSQACVII